MVTIGKKLEILKSLNLAHLMKQKRNLKDERDLKNDSVQSTLQQDFALVWEVWSQEYLLLLAAVSEILCLFSLQA